MDEGEGELKGKEEGGWRGRGRGGGGEMEGGQGISQFQKNSMNYCFLANTLRMEKRDEHSRKIKMSLFVDIIYYQTRIS